MTNTAGSSVWYCRPLGVNVADASVQDDRNKMDTIVIQVAKQFKVNDTVNEISSISIF
jgi:hypothetical protein